MNYTTHAENVTRRLVYMIQTGSHGRWAMPWHTHDLGDLLTARNATTGNRYAGANVLTLAIDALERGYPTGEWATYKQWQTAGAQVRKGEHAAHIIKWVTTKTSDNADTETDGETFGRPFVPRVYAVFNAHQVDGHTPTETEPAEPTPASEWLDAIGADVHYGGDRAYYAPTTDRIYCPALEQFDDPEAFWSTVLHEHIHWTGHHSRLDRLNISAPFGSPDYAAEELVAELGAAIAAASLDISPQPRADHAAYLAHWLDILNEDPKALFRTAAAAQRAVDHLHQLATHRTEAEEVAQ